MIKLLLLICVSGWFLATEMRLPETVAPQPNRPPNIVLILADDMGWGDIRFHDNPVLNTPTLDLLGRQGARFDRFFVSPLCAPTRASLLTGRYHLRTGVASVTGGLETMRSAETTMAEVFRRAGYATGVFGKWHNGAHYPENPTGQGFDEFFGFCGGHWVNYFDTQLQHNSDVVDTRGYITDVLTDAAIRFIEKQQDRPFFCYVPFNAPHGPFQVPDAFFDPYKAKGLDDHDAAIYGMVENMDGNIDRLLKKLDELRLRENTIVVFLTDNGPNGQRYNGHMNGVKGSVHEGGGRVPLFISWPGHIAPNTLVKPLAAHIDLLPTLAELAGVAWPTTLPLDGRSLVPLLRNAQSAWPDRTLYTHVHKASSGMQLQPYPGGLRTEQYRYIRGKDTDELYDMRADAGEKTNLAPRLTALTSQFRVQYDHWFTEVTQTPIHPEITQVGYAEAPQVQLYAPDAKPLGGLAYFGGNGWVHDWFRGFQTPDQAAVWTINVVQGGRYSLAIAYNCPPEFMGNLLAIKVAGQTRQVPVQSAFLGKLTPLRDRVDRPEAPLKEWATLEVGAIDIPKGIHTLTIHSVGTAPVPFELKSVQLQKR